MATIDKKNYIRHAVKATSDERVMRLLAEHRYAGYGVYWRLMEHLRQVGGRCPSDYRALSYTLREKASLIQSVVENFGLFIIEGDAFYSADLMNQMDSEKALSEKRRKAIGNRWNNEPQKGTDDNTNVIQMNNNCNTNVIQMNNNCNTNVSDIDNQEVSDNNPEIAISPPVPPIYLDNINNINILSKEKETPNKLGVENEKGSEQAPPAVGHSPTTTPKEEKALAIKKKTAPERAQDFYVQLVPYVEKYGREMIRNFYDYWSEYSSERSKMRFEKQPTWNLARRLATWSKRDNEYHDERNTKYRNAAEQKQEANDYALRSLEEDLRRFMEGGAGDNQTLSDGLPYEVRTE
jgi:hypothetical protein